MSRDVRAINFPAFIAIDQSARLSQQYVQQSRLQLIYETEGTQVNRLLKIKLSRAAVGIIKWLGEVASPPKPRRLGRTLFYATLAETIAKLK